MSDGKKLPCVAAYNFTLFDSSQDLRFCCHGLKKYGPYKNLRKQWTDKTYSRFREEWSKRYHQGSDLCTGCAHHAENEKWAGVIQNYLDQHKENPS